MQFLDSHQNLKRSNLLESPSDPGKKFFKGRAVPNPVDVTTGTANCDLLSVCSGALDSSSDGLLAQK